MILPQAAIPCFAAAMLAWAGWQPLEPAPEAPVASEPPIAVTPPNRSGTSMPADTAITIDGVQVRVKSARVGRVPFKAAPSGNTLNSDDPVLIMGLEINNLSETKKFTYRTWRVPASFSDAGAILTDNFDNEYEPLHVSFGKTHVRAIDRASVYPGSSVDDVIVFERPVAKAEHLNLTLPASNVGGEGTLRLRIPTSFVVHAELTVQGTPGTSFFGMRVDGSRFAYVVDVSGSMSVNGKLDALKQQLVHSIESIVDDGSFLVVPYSDVAAPLANRREWVDADERGDQWARQNVHRLEAGGATHPEGAFEVIFRMRPKADAIFFLTDGEFEPSIADDIIVLNSELRIPIYCICLETRASEALMTKIANKLGGAFKFVAGTADQP